MIDLDCAGVSLMYHEEDDEKGKKHKETER